MPPKPELLIGNAIRESRVAETLTLAELSQKTGLSKAFLSKIENDRTSPSIPTLWKIARALGIGLGEFFDGIPENPNPVPAIVKAAERKTVARGSADFGYTYEGLARGKKSKIEPFIVRFSPLNRTTKALIHPGHEFNFVLEGTIQFIYGDKSYVLKKGDSAYYDSSVPHRGYALGKKDAAVLAILIEDVG